MYKIIGSKTNNLVFFFRSWPFFQKIQNYYWSFFILEKQMSAIFIFSKKTVDCFSCWWKKCWLFLNILKLIKATLFFYKKKNFSWEKIKKYPHFSYWWKKFQPFHVDEKNVSRFSCWGKKYLPFVMLRKKC